MNQKTTVFFVYILHYAAKKMSKCERTPFTTLSAATKEAHNLMAEYTDLEYWEIRTSTGKVVLCCDDPEAYELA